MALTVVIAAAAALDPAAPATAPLARAVAQPDWRKEFEDVCARTQDSMTLPSEELRSLVARCDKLKAAIESLDETERKVYSRRLRACRDLYAFVLESRESR